MEVNCKSCGAANDDQARFCDQCGSLLDAALASLEASAVPTASAASKALPPASATPAATVNWPGLAVIALVLLGLGFLFFGKPSTQAGTVPAGSAVNPHGEAGQGAMDPGQSFEQAQADLQEFRARLEQDPLDIEAITGLYNLYAQIGQAEKVRDQLNTSLTVLKERHASGQVGKEAAKKLALDMAMAAMGAEDTLGGLDAMKVYYELNPERSSTAAMIGNIYYDIGLVDDALFWYDEYLSKADPLAEAETVLSVRVDRLSLLLQQAVEADDKAGIDRVIEELTRMTVEHPVFWAAKFNLGVAYKHSGDLPKALQLWNEALPLAGDATEKWQVEAAIAEAEGRPAPPLPPSEDLGSTNLDPATSPH